jgi:hypothetical protein
MIYEWKLDGIVRNFGDALPEVFLPSNTFQEWQEDEIIMHFPIGSVIDNWTINNALEYGFKPVFHGCGARGTELDTALLEQCSFVGVRGPRTRDELLKHGIDTKVVLDPAYKIKGKIVAGSPSGLALVIRHIQDTSDYSQDSIQELGADALFSPAVDTKQDVISLAQKISGARFVLAGSLHAAIIAHCYDVPFALLDTGFVDCPFKWWDWLNSVGVTDVQWVDNVIDGRAWYRSAVKR